jgi:hypothetical protein
MTLNKSIKGIFIVLVLGLIFFLLIASQCLADEKTELQWEARALWAESQLAICNAQKDSPQVQSGQTAIREFLKKLDAKGFMFQQDGTIIEKPKPQPKKE